MPELTLLQDMAIVMAVSAAVMVFCYRWHLPVVLGYILAGLIIGPYTPPFPLVQDIESVKTLSELGVIFLLFGIGLEFSLTRLMRVGIVSLFAATLEIVLMLGIGYSLGQAFGWSFMDSLFLGAILSISSTTIIAKILLETGKLDKLFAHVILGILIIEDLLAIVIIAVLSGLASTGALTWAAAGAASVKVGAFVAGTIFLGLWLVPMLLRYLERFQSAELMVVTVLGLCFGVSLTAAHLGFSVALGAFLIGAVIAETPQAKGIVHRMEPIRDMFTAIFFVSVGMLINPALLAQYAWPIVIISVVTIVGKVVSCTFATFLTGYAPDTSLRVGLGLAQIGEFSFIIARLGERTRVTSSFLYPIAVSVSALTTLTTPLLMRQAEGIVKTLTRLSPKPLLILGNVYTAWLERLRRGSVGSEKQQAIWAGLRTQLPRLAIYAGSALALPLLGAHLAPRFPIAPVWYWTLVGVAMFPLLFAVAYTLDQVLWNVLVPNLMPSRQGSAQERETQDALRHLLRFLIILVCGLGVLTLSAWSAPLMSVSLGLLLLLGVSGLMLWGSARRLHERMERVVLQVFEREQPIEEEPQWKQSHDQLVELIREEYPWEVETQDLLLPYQESAVHQTIRNLKLRTKTGATIVAIYRGADSLINPSPDTLLMPGDVLLLMGSQEQITAGMQYLTEQMREPAPHAGQSEPKTLRFEVPQGSGWIGKTIGELNLRRNTQVHVVGIQKATEAITNPDVTVLIDAGDVLILFGRADQLETAVRHLSK